MPAPAPPGCRRNGVCRTQVWGCGEATAERWYAAGCRSLDDVRARPGMLNDMQRLGLMYYDDFEVGRWPPAPPGGGSGGFIRV